MVKRFPDINLRHLSQAPFGSACFYRGKPGKESKWETRGKEGIVIGVFQQDNGMVDGSWLVYDQNDLLNHLANGTLLQQPFRTRDCQPTKDLRFPIKELRVLAKVARLSKGFIAPSARLSAVLLGELDGEEGNLSLEDDAESDEERQH